MKGRGLLTHTSPRGRRLRAWSALAFASGALLAGCGIGRQTDDAAVLLPAEAIAADLESSGYVTPTDLPIASGVDRPATSVTTIPSTTAPPATSTTVAATAPPTVVVTLPQPAAPPAPRADEPYIELGTIEIPRLALTQRLLEGISLNTLDLGPGHWPGTALPGQLGNAVIAGHRTSHGKVFRNIDQLEPGDEVIFTTTEGRFVYLVTETTIVAPNALYIIDQTMAHTATLFACHPPGSTKQRIVVHLELQGS